MSYYIVHNNSKSFKHAAPYSTPNTRKRLLARWTVKNLRVFQETPGNANSGIFASFDLVNANNPKEKAHNMQFSFADGTSADKNIINRIRRFFNDAYNRQRGYGFPELTEMEKQQIVARINTAYNQWSGFSHSDTSDHIEHADDEPDVIDCTSEIKMSDFKKNGNYLEHFGILGMKWGVRRFQNPDGTLTNAGRKRYGVSNDPHKRVLAVVPAGTLPNSTRITGKEESDFWKAYAKQITDMQDALKNGDKEKYNKARNSFKSDEDKDKAERIAEKTNKPTRSYTPEQQKEKLEKAKKEDQYDLLFLEAIQNTRMFTTDDDKASIDKAYKEYLKDPDGFFTDPDFYKKYPAF